MTDPDGDGLANLLEFAFGLDPRAGDASSVPQWQWTSAYGYASFTQPVGITGITYGAEWSTTLEANGWNAIPDTGTNGQHVFVFPKDGAPRKFVRWKITKLP